MPLLGKLGGETLVLGDRIAKLRSASSLEAEQQRNDSDALRQNAYQLFEGARTPGRSDHSDHAAPECKTHPLLQSAPSARFSDVLSGRPEPHGRVIAAVINLMGRAITD